MRFDFEMRWTYNLYVHLQTIVSLCNYNFSIRIGRRTLCEVLYMYSFSACDRVVWRNHWIKIVSLSIIKSNYYLILSKCSNFTENIDKFHEVCRNNFFCLFFLIIFYWIFFWMLTYIKKERPSADLKVTEVNLFFVK